MKNTLKKVLALLLIAATLAITVSTAFASGTTLYTTGNVNLRKGAGKDYKIITSLQSGAKVTKLDSKQDSRGVTWYQVKTKSGKTGWISSVYLSTEKGGSAKKIRMTGDSYIRNSASLKGKSIGLAEKGEKLSYTDTKKDSRGVVWYLITDGNLVGWVSSKYTVKI